ncbi:hypothetical protein SBF1_8560001 [Candidatus Desulfosporosinus infrequens]|uniref:Uncharacterized protein n=1 Tax=Candidatus Desulfosporosinus infrequens TaxID=2043169 RepID=A0A2U3LUY3_9FIRM|nr:hypothetical protein SBF1_8560001 [Candidatus Desulfosporosinus infrequens]
MYLFTNDGGNDTVMSSAANHEDVVQISGGTKTEFTYQGNNVALYLVDTSEQILSSMTIADWCVSVGYQPKLEDLSGHILTIGTDITSRA